MSIDAESCVLTLPCGRPRMKDMTSGESACAPAPALKLVHGARFGPVDLKGLVRVSALSMDVVRTRDG